LTLNPGTRLGPYEILSAIGAGGMGEVYKARDTKLDRDVAIKILPEAFAADAERVARFQREAKTLAALNHPNIAQIFGLEQAGDVHALAMELVAGDDLSQRIARGAIPLDEALPIARQIAEALEAAHGQGIIHRDLKPANIKVGPDGTVKVLDFGLAKLAHPETLGDHADVTASPTITSPAKMTGVGVILGTAAYMSPEQAKGREADTRSDIWAFGAVLYEMLTGRRAFDGEDMTDVLGAVVRLEPNWEALPSDVPPPVRTLLQSCLVKDRRRRVADISTALFVLDKAASLAAPIGTASVAPLPRKPLWQRVVTPVAAALVASAVVGTAVWFATRPISPRVARFPLTTASADALSINAVERDLAITPDGSRIVYVRTGGAEILMRSLDQIEPTVVARGLVRGVFFSPDGHWVGFIDNNRTLKKVAITGGPSLTLTLLDGGSRGASWAPEDTIIFATNNLATGLQRVSAAGGEPTVVTRPNRDRGEADHLWPEILPGGRGVLFTVIAVSGGLDAAQIAVLDLDTGAQTIVLRGGSHAHYVSTGHLVYAAGGALRAVAFDLSRREVRGTPVSVLPRVMTTTYGAGNYGVAAEGTLVYVEAPGTMSSVGFGADRTLVWVDRAAREEPLAAPPRAYRQPRLSPDGTRIAVSIQDQEQDLWMWDLSRATLTRLTSAPGVDWFPLWTTDGRRIVFSSSSAGEGGNTVFWMPADGTGKPERLTSGGDRHYATGLSPDGTQVVFSQITQAQRADLLTMSLDGDHRVQPLLQTMFDEQDGTISPDGRWIAYESDNSGRSEIYVRPFPAVAGGQWQVSTAGGRRPLWARDGQELFYFATAGPTSTLMRVPIGARSTAWSAGTPVVLFQGRYFTETPGRTYDVSPDGRRFLMVKEAGADLGDARPQIIVVQHWFEELKRLVPTN
jgi:serine/threonine-protein kinase